MRMISLKLWWTFALPRTVQVSEGNGTCAKASSKAATTKHEPLIVAAPKVGYQLPSKSSPYIDVPLQRSQWVPIWLLLRNSLAIVDSTSPGAVMVGDGKETANSSDLCGSSVEGAARLRAVCYCHIVESQLTRRREVTGWRRKANDRSAQRWQPHAAWDHEYRA